MKHNTGIWKYFSVLLAWLVAFGCGKEDVTPPTVSDIDGNTYHMVTIGTQTWMVENLRTTRYNDGASITNVMEDTTWEYLTTPAWCTYNNTTNIANIHAYGRLYNWYAVNTGKLAPKGWHVPSNEEWNVLLDYLGGDSIAGDKLKEAGADHWQGPNPYATNESGFTALPGGWRYFHDGSFNYFGEEGCWWSSSDYSASGASYLALFYNESKVYLWGYNKSFGYSVRCLRD
jgi:uncharacterized protein (TIGR02145 family)